MRPWTPNKLYLAVMTKSVAAEGFLLISPNKQRTGAKEKQEEEQEEEHEEENDGI